jgi:two-component system, NarL family, uhpT operon response regulator UhpA
MTRPRPRLVIVDDHRLVVQGLQQMLGVRYEIAGVAYAGDELLQLLRRTPTDVVLLDLSLPGRGGLELLPEILALQPGLRVLVLTMHVDRILAEAALAAGAMGFVPKDAGMEELERALDAVLAGQRFLSERVPRTSHRVGLDAMHASLSRLTPRQQTILRLIGKGKTSGEIAAKLGLSESTITFHRQRIRRLLGLASEWELVRHAILVEVASRERKAP